MIAHLRGRDRKLELHGWTGQEAEWIALVCLHSGVFTRAQFCQYFDTDRKRALRFVKPLIERQTGRRDRVADYERRSEDVPHIEQGDLPGARS